MLHGSLAPPRERNGGLTQRGGYRNLFGAPGGVNGTDTDSPDLFQGYGQNTTDILIRLARCLEKPYPWPEQPGLRRDENPKIPAGYTYLAQLVAHDLTFLGSTLTPLETSPGEDRNLRALALNLETIYGGGPVEHPSSYCFERDGSPRLRLRLGLLREESDGMAASDLRRQSLSRDLPRATCPDLQRMAGEPRPEGESDPSRWLTEVLISDPRNDDHLLVGQTAVLFHLLHNHVCDRLGTDGAAVVASLNDRHGVNGREPDLFAAARRVVTKIYRDIVREDLMRRLLCEPVHAYYVAEDSPPLDATDNAGMPVEFSHAAFRIGHAMVQPSYKLRHEVDFNLEDLLRYNSQLLYDRMPPRWSWLVRWQNFYELSDDGPVNLSRRIGPSQNRVLVTSPLIGLSDDPVDPKAQTGLPRRDLLRSGLVGCRSVESLIRCIRDAAPQLLAQSAFLRDEDPRARRKLVRDFLDDHTARGEPFTEPEKDAIAADPPLVLFCLLEAAAEQDGYCLGVLGSVIVGEVIFRAMRDAKVEDDGKAPAMDTLIAAVFGSGGEGHAGENPLGSGVAPRTMPDLIRYLAVLPFLQNQEPEFI